MKDYKEHNECRQLNMFSDYLYEAKVELEGNGGVQSVLGASEEGQNGESEDRLLERIFDRNNMNLAYKRVKKNKGSAGIDGITVDDLLVYLKENGDRIKQEVREGKYKPKAVRRVEISKPDGGIRLLGIPTVVDRVFQQAIAQVLSPIFEKQFSDSSYGFRPNRSAKQAILKSVEYINEGYRWIVDIDLAKYFDTVNHDILMGLLSKTIKDKRVLLLIRKYLQSGVMINGVVHSTDEGTPQGGNLSPLLSNVMLNELDKELTKRGLKFCRYADDCNIYVRSRKSASRVMASITRFIEGKLKLKINREKSKICKPPELKFLGFSYYYKKGGIGIKVHQKSVRKLKEKLKEITMRSNAMSMGTKLFKVKEVIVGWVNYFGLADIKTVAGHLDEWLRRRLRMCIWKNWKKIKTKKDNLIKLGLDKQKAHEYANTRKSYWRIANSPILARTLTNERLRNLGFHSISERYSQVH